MDRCQINVEDDFYDSQYHRDMNEDNYGAINESNSVNNSLNGLICCLMDTTVYPSTHKQYYQVYNNKRHHTDVILPFACVCIEHKIIIFGEYHSGKLLNNDVNYVFEITLVL